MFCEATRPCASSWLQKKGFPFAWWYDVWPNGVMWWARKANTFGWGCECVETWLCEEWNKIFKERFRSFIREEEEEDRRFHLYGNLLLFNHANMRTVQIFPCFSHLYPGYSILYCSTVGSIYNVTHNTITAICNLQSFPPIINLSHLIVQNTHYAFSTNKSIQVSCKCDNYDTAIVCSTSALSLQNTFVNKSQFLLSGWLTQFC